MSREIKFRAWDSKINRFLAGMVWQGSDINRPFKDFPAHHVISQYTGLLDKNGKEIYEGDILNIGGWNLPMVVSFHDGSFTVSNPSAAVYHYITAHWIQDINNTPEVIGNIWENPELIKEE